MIVGQWFGNGQKNVKTWIDVWSVQVFFVYLQKKMNKKV